MSRRVAFRAWNKLAHKMADITAIDFQFDAYRAIAGKSSGSGHLTDIDLMQFTGLKDKAGKDIYEGDIIKGRYDYGSFGNPIEAVTYVDGTWNYSYALQETREQSERDWEVIGNLYETPELLPKEK